MKKRSSAAYLALFLGLSVTLAGCGYLNQVRAMKAFKDGNKAYAASDWRVAINKYEEAAQLTANDTACQWCPAIYFYLANSYDNMYRPARKGEPANDALMQKAVDNYKLAREEDDGNRRRDGRGARVPGRPTAPDSSRIRRWPSRRQAHDRRAPKSRPTISSSRRSTNSGEYQLAEETYLKAAMRSPTTRPST